jgi:hypothetical protein
LGHPGKRTLVSMINPKERTVPIIRDISLNLSRSEILRREGFKEYAEIRPQIQDQIEELLLYTTDAGLLQPVTAYDIYTVKEITPQKMLLNDDASVNGTLLPTTFPEAVELAVMVCTIGPALEKRVTEYTNSSETLRAMLLDGIGSAAVDILEQEACCFISKQAVERGHQAGSPVNPGMPGLDIREQQNILDLAHGEETGVSLTSSGIMVPRKSTSLVIAIGSDMDTWTQEEVCARCNLKETCPHCVLR